MSGSDAILPDDSLFDDGPLAGVRVVERAGRLAGGVCALLLHQLGARVIRFEHGDDPPPLALEGPAAETLAALLRVGRRRVRYTPEAFAQALAGADVAIVAPLGPTPAEAPELAALRAQGERLVGCVLTPYGLAGPTGDLPPGGEELELQAVSGVMATTGAHDGPPLPVGVPVGELLAGLNGAVAVLAALRVRERGDGGQWADVAAFDALLGAMGTFMPLAVADPQASLRQGCRHALTAPWNAYPTADGQVILCTTTEAQWQRLLALAGRSELRDDPRFAGSSLRVRHVDAVDAIVAAWSGGLPTREVLAALTAADISAGAVMSVPQLLQDAAFRARGMVWAVRDEHGQAQSLAGPVVRIVQRAAERSAPEPATVAALEASLPADPWNEAADEAVGNRVVGGRSGIGRGGRAGKSAGSGAASRAAPPLPLPLAGVRVLDVTTYTAGPLATRNLAGLGAEVIKVETLQGEACRPWVPATDGTSLYFSNNNTDKRALALDLKQDAGRRAFAALAARCDVLVENMRPGALERLGLGYAALSADNPGLVYCSVAGYGQRGEHAGKAAYDTVIQAESGLMSLLSSEGAMKMGPSISDVMGALFAPLAVLAALRLRERDGRGCHVDLSMQDCTAWLTQLAWPGGGAGLPPWERVACADGTLLALAAAEPVRSLLGRGESTGTCAEVQGRLAAGGVAAVRVRELGEVLASEHVARRGLVPRIRNGQGSAVPVLAPFYRLQRTPPRLERLLGEVGADTAAILAEVGYSAAQIAELARDGVIRPLPTHRAPGPQRAEARP